MEERVLIINTTDAAPVAEQVLDQAGIASETVYDADTAAGQLANGGYRVAVLLASESEAVELCDTLRRLGRTPLILVSPGISTEACVRAIEAGADFCLRRAYGPLEFIARVRVLGARRRPAREPAFSSMA